MPKRYPTYFLGEILRTSKLWEMRIAFSKLALTFSTVTTTFLKCLPCLFRHRLKVTVWFYIVIWLDNTNHFADKRSIYLLALQFYKLQDYTVIIMRSGRVGLYKYYLKCLTTLRNFIIVYTVLKTHDMISLPLRILPLLFVITRSFYNFCLFLSASFFVLVCHTHYNTSFSV